MELLSKAKPLPVIAFLKAKGVDVSSFEGADVYYEKRNEELYTRGQKWSREEHNKIYDELYGKDFASRKTGKAYLLILAVREYFN